MTPRNGTIESGDHDKLKLDYEDWGLIKYSEAQNRQLQYVQEVASGLRPSTLVFCTHPSVVTLGRANSSDDIQSWTGEVIQTSRGGRATYHGPGQIVFYPIVDLNQRFNTMRSCDLHAWIGLLETVVSEVLKAWAISATQGGKRGKQSLEKGQDSGVWVGSRKIASIGIAVKKWVTYHGVAINVWHDKSAFVGVNPCGFQPSIMIDVEEILGRHLSRRDVVDELTRVFVERI